MSEQINELAAALAKVQAEIRPALKDAENPHLRTKYADLGSVWDACREVLPRHGLAVIQTTEAFDPPVLVTTLVHSSGQWISGSLPMIYAENEKGRSQMQSLGSALSYCRRYALASIVGVITEDDDGHAAGRRQEDRRNGHQPARQNFPARQTKAPQAGGDKWEPKSAFGKWAQGKAEGVGAEVWWLVGHLYKEVIEQGKRDEHQHVPPGLVKGEMWQAVQNLWNIPDWRDWFENAAEVALAHQAAEN